MEYKDGAQAGRVYKRELDFMREPSVSLLLFPSVVFFFRSAFELSTLKLISS